MTELLAVFARTPELGKVKTRLSPPLSPAQVLALHRAFVEDTLAHMDRLERPGLEKHLLLTHPLTDDSDLSVPEGWQTSFQIEGDLGARMGKLFQTSFARSVSRVIIVGTDSPTLPLAVVEEAFNELQHGQVVLGPAEDGGYYLIGCTSWHPELFSEIDWGTSAVLEQTLERIASVDVPLKTLIPWYDVDRSDDLEKLRQEIAYLQRSSPHLVPMRIAAVIPDATGDSVVSVDTDF